MAATINKIGMFLFECVTTEKYDKEIKNRAEIMLPKALNMAIKVLDLDSYSIPVAVIEILSNYLSLLKKIGINETHKEMLQTIFQIIVKRLPYPSWYSFDQEIEPNSLEEQYVQFRNGLTTLFINMVEIKPIQPDIINFVSDSLQKMQNSPQVSILQKEVILYLFHNMGAAICDANFKLEDWIKRSTDPRFTMLNNCMNIILAMPDLFNSLPLIFIGYEIIVRYSQFFSIHPDLLDSIFKLFTSDLYFFIISKQNKKRNIFKE